MTNWYKAGAFPEADSAPGVLSDMQEITFLFQGDTDLQENLPLHTPINATPHFYFSYVVGKFLKFSLSILASSIQKL